MSEASEIIQRAREAALLATERFDHWDIAAASDAAADAALRSVLEVLVNPPWGSAEVYAAEMLKELSD